MVKAMNAKTGIERIWAGLDNLLLAAVFVLLAFVWYSDRSGAVSFSRLRRVQDRPEEQIRRPLSADPVDGIRVSSAQVSRRMIARSLSEADWERMTPTPAMDMREEGKAYEVTFPLPEKVDRESVRVTTSGNVLTLTMKNGDTGSIFMQRIRIPCLGDHTEKTQSFLTNNVLRIRITPSGG